MSWFKNYVENIAVTLILTSFAGVIMPNGKYKEYVRLVMGLGIIIAIISPLSGFINSDNSFEDFYKKAEQELNMEVVNIEKTGYGPELINAIISDYKKGLTAQMAEKTAAYGYRLAAADIEVGTGDENFGAIIYLGLTLESSQRAVRPIIKVDKISVSGINSPSDSKDESKQIKELKNFLSDFYNLSIDNIYITVSQ